MTAWEKKKVNRKYEDSSYRKICRKNRFLANAFSKVSFAMPPGYKLLLILLIRMNDYHVALQKHSLLDSKFEFRGGGRN